MIVPPRLVAAWLLACASALVLAEAATSAFAQTASNRSLAEIAGVAAPRGQGAWGAAGGQPASRGAASPPGVWTPRAELPGRPGYVPRHLRPVATTAPSGMSTEIVDAPPEYIDEGALVPDGREWVEGEPGDVVFDHFPGDAPGCTDGSCGASCGSCDCHCCCFCIPCLGFPHSFTLYGGVHGFKGPMNRGSDSSFGFDEALNWGGPLNLVGGGCGLGVQLGVRGVQSNFSGATGLTLDDRNQLFVTAGLFRRVDCGLQGGAVIDYLHEDWDIDLDIAQVRGEISWVFVTQSEFGFRYAGPVTVDNSPTPAALVGVDWETTETFAFFFRQKLSPCGGECQVFAGFSGRSDGLLGASAAIPLADHIALSAEFTYLIPDTGAATLPIPGSIEESWNVGMGLVIYPDAGFLNPANYYRPLFDVANNGSLMYDLD